MGHDTHSKPVAAAFEDEGAAVRAAAELERLGIPTVVSPTAIGAETVFWRRLLRGALVGLAVALPVALAITVYLWRIAPDPARTGGEIGHNRLLEALLIGTQIGFPILFLGTFLAMTAMAALGSREVAARVTVMSRAPADRENEVLAIIAKHGGEPVPPIMERGVPKSRPRVE
jgi:hypothetical protein